MISINILYAPGRSDNPVMAAPYAPGPNTEALMHALVDMVMIDENYLTPGARQYERARILQQMQDVIMDHATRAGQTYEVRPIDECLLPEWARLSAIDREQEG